MTSSDPRSSGAAEVVGGVENPAARRRDVDVGAPLRQGFAKACLERGRRGGRGEPAARVSGGGEVLQLGDLGLRLSYPLGRPLLPFYRWQGPLGRPQTCPQFWTSSGRFRSPETYSKTASFPESELDFRKLSLPLKATWLHLLWNHPDFLR